MWGVLIFFLVVAGMVASVKTGKLSPAASIMGGMLGLLLFYGTGGTGFVLMTAFFILGTAATGWKSDSKRRLNDMGNESRRTMAQVLANAGVAGILSILGLFFPEHHTLLLLMLAGAFSSATADTVSSELGIVYGRKFYNILSLKRDVRGADGVISMEGTLWGVAGSAAIAGVYAAFEGFNHSFFCIIVAGTLGNLCDSILGASLERKNRIGNNAVNFFNTLCGALLALALYVL